MTTPMLQALIFDVDGTLADTERAHLDAFNHAFRAVGLDWHWDLERYTELLATCGGKERIRAYWESLPDAPRAIDALAFEHEISRIHEIKTAAYEQAVRDGQVQMRPGVLALMAAAADAGLRLAIATTTSASNVSALLRRALGADWRSRFAAIEDASTAAAKKPDPQAYRQALRRLGLPASACVAFEDSRNGLRAALGAGLATIVTPNEFTRRHDFVGALRVLPSLESVTPERLRGWHAERAMQAA
ncbi:MAG TPA: HAD-IA family hydrolase [Telluria sp.]|nr:HAD-IA family hydrolase [Telluria sp.]